MTQNLRKASLRTPNLVCALFPLVVVFLWVFASGCGNGGPSGPSFPPPFDTAKGEGDLISDQLVVTYPTATTETATTETATTAKEMGLNTYYSQTICPPSLSPNECATNENSLNTPQFGNFNVNADPIGSNPLGIKLVDAVKIDYTAMNIDQSAVRVSGGILIPQVTPESLRGLILYFHGTTVQRTYVPSNFMTSTSTNAATDGILMAAVWASQGYIVVLPDYIGLGDDTTHPHPYVVYPAQDAQSGLAMVKAARSFLASAYNITGRIPLYVTGYSEGGSYSLEAAHLMQNNRGYASVLQVELRKAVPVSGFYDLSGTGLPYLFDNISRTNNNWNSLNTGVSAVSKPFLMAYVALAFANYSGIDATDILADAFYTCLADFPCGTSGNLDGLYFTGAQSAGYNDIVALIVVNQAQNTAWTPDNNAVTPLLTETYANALTQKDPGNPLYRKVADSDSYFFIPRFPVTIVSLMEDSVVPRKNSDVAFAHFRQFNPNGPYKEDLVNNTDFVVPGFAKAGPVDHITELPFLSVLILNEFNTALSGTAGSSTRYPLAEMNAPR